MVRAWTWTRCAGTLPAVGAHVTDEPEALTEEAPRARPGPSLLQLATYAVGVALLGGLVIAAGPRQVLRTLAAVSPAWILASLSLIALALIVTGLRWGWLMRSVRPEARVTVVLGAFLSNAFVSNLSPARSGEVLAPLLIARRCGVTPSAALAVIVVNRVLETLWLLLLCVFAALRIAHPEGGALMHILGAFAAAATAFGLLLAALAAFGRRRAGAAPVESGALLGRVRSRVRAVTTSLALFGDVRRLIGPLAMAGLTWALQLVAIWALVNAAVPISLVDSVVAQIVSVVAGVLSLVPGGLGVTTASYVWVAGQLGYPWEPVAAVGAAGVVLAHGLRFGLALGADVAWARSRAPLPEG